jgi:hypothetical protein
VKRAALAATDHRGLTSSNETAEFPLKLAHGRDAGPRGPLAREEAFVVIRLAPPVSLVVFDGKGSAPQDVHVSGAAKA